jgi:hypothetical protein
LDRLSLALNHNFKFEFADQDSIVGLEDNLALNALSIDERAIRAAEVAEADTVIVDRKNAVMAAD